MPWVRAHYRRPRARRGTSANGAVGLIILLLLAAAIAMKVVVAIIAAGIALVKAFWWALLGLAVGTAAIGAVIFTSRRNKKNALQLFEEHARTLASTSPASEADADSLTAMARRIGRLPAEIILVLESLYRDAVARAIEDRHIDREERRRLDLLARAFNLSQASVEQAELEAFLEIYTDVVADKRLTAAEEQVITGLQAALRIPEASIRKEVDHLLSLRIHRADLLSQLTTAREVMNEDVQPIVVPIPLRRGERCYFTSPFTEKKLKVVSTFSVGGQRFSDKDLVDERAGTLYVTNLRLLLVHGGTTSIAANKLLDIKVDEQTNILSLVIDGRKSAHYFVVPQPFVLAAFLHRAPDAA